MYNELYKYLILHKQLNIPGIGRFEMEKKPADVDFATRVIHAPQYYISFRQTEVMPSRKFFNWLEAEMGISEMEAVRKFNEFTFDLRNELSPENEVYWEKVGRLKKWRNGEIMFEPATGQKTLENPVAAKKVIREKAQHLITVGERERTSDEMLEMLFPEEETKSYWWVAPLAIAIAAFIFIAYHLSANGVKPSSSGNKQKLFPAEVTITY